MELYLFLDGHKGEFLSQSPCVENGMSQLVSIIFVVSNEEYLTVLDKLESTSEVCLAFFLDVDVISSSKIEIKISLLYRYLSSLI